MKYGNVFVCNHAKYLLQIFAKYLTFASVGLQNAVQFQVILVIVPDENALLSLIISKISPAGFNRYATQVARLDEARRKCFDNFDT